MKSRISFCLAAVCLAAIGSSLQAAEPKALGPEPKLTVVNISSHCDWAWVHSRAWHEERYAETIRQVLLLMRKHPHYVWQLENENEQLAPFLKKAAKEWPELVDEFWQRVREGRIEVVVAISNPRISEVYPETFVRNLVLGKQYFRHHAPGIKQDVYQAVDLMCGSSQIPQILAGADYRYFMFTRPVRQQVVFWRTGLDGTRMLTARCVYGYHETGMIGRFGQGDRGIRPVSIWRIPVGADDQLPSPAIAAESETWDRGKKVLGTIARYFEEVEKSGDEITELGGVLDSLEYYTSCGLHGNRSLFTWNNRNEDLLLSLEKAQVMASTRGGSFPTVAMDRRWHDLLSCTGHAILWLFKADYDERYAKVQQTRDEGERALDETLAAVARGIRFRLGAGSPLVVFNFHAWPVTGPVELVLDGDAAGTVLRDASGSEVPLQVVDGETAGPGGQPVAFIAEEVPACGYKTFYLARSQGRGPVRPAAQPSPGAIENDHYRVEIKPDGRVEITDKKRGKPLGSPEHGGLGDLAFYDSPNSGDWVTNGPLGASHAWQPQASQGRVVQGPVFASVRLDGSIGPHVVSREVRLWRGSRRVEYLVQIDAQEGSGVFSIRFPTGLPDGRVFAGIPFGAEPREDLQREPFREESFVRGYPKGYYATRWTDVSTADFGYTLVCPAGMHTGYAYDRLGQKALEFVLLRLWPMPAAGSKSWTIHSHPSLKGTGRHTWRCALVPHQGTWREAASYRDALEQHIPLLAFSPGGGLRRASLNGTAPTGGTRSDDAASFAEVLPQNVVLSSFRLVGSVKEKTPEWELRLYETAGQASDVVVRLGCRVDAVRQTDLLGEPVEKPGKIDVAGREIRFRIPPWKIVTLRVTPDGERHAQLAPEKP